MIRVDRPPRPRILEGKADQWLRDLQGANSDTERRRITERYRHRDIKRSLVQMFHGKCAYCESTIIHIDYGHIEHYRPKSGPAGRADLIFEWTNLLLACGVCNGGEFKSDHFPSAREGGPLVNPCDEEPRDHFEFRYDSSAKLASVYGITDRGETTEKLLGLNRPALRKHRSAFINKLVVLATFADSVPAAKSLVEQAIESEAEYAAFARAMFFDMLAN